MATGSVLFLRKFRPLSGVPAGTELCTRTGAEEGLPGFATPVASGDGVNGVLSGCAAEVDVAGGAGEADRAASVLGAFADAARVVVKARTAAVAGLAAERRPREPVRRRQRGQIMVGAGFGAGEGCWMQCLRQSSQWASRISVGEWLGHP